MNLPRIPTADRPAPQHSDALNSMLGLPPAEPAPTPRPDLDREIRRRELRRRAANRSINRAIAS